MESCGCGLLVFDCEFWKEKLSCLGCKWLEIDGETSDGEISLEAGFRNE